MNEVGVVDVQDIDGSLQEMYMALVALVDCYIELNDLYVIVTVAE